jgi:hypothetical protein
MNEITLRDVARYLEGMVDDPEESRRILEALESDPSLAAPSEFLCSDIDDESDQQERISLPDLSQTRLGRLTFVPDWSTWNDGTSVKTDMQVLDGPAVLTVPVTLTRQGEAITMHGGGVTGLMPISLILGRFDFEKGRSKPLVIENFLFPDVRPEPMNGPGRLDGLVVPVVGKADAAPRGRGDAGAFDSNPHFFVKRQGRALLATAVIPEDQDGDVAIAELSGLPNGETVRHPLEFDRPGSNRTITGKFPFPWPAIAPTPCTLTIRALQAADLPWLSTNQVSSILAWQQEHFTSVPLLPNPQGELKGRIRYSFQVEAAKDPATCWLVRLDVIGGAA